MEHAYWSQEPARADIDASRGPLLLEFGAPWCPHCQALQPLLQAALAEYPALVHCKVEDAAGRPLGRSYRVKLWPTLILLRDGQELARLVRCTDAASLALALRQISETE